ncbi:MAG: hypothetical protein M3416_01935 [Acidobacteriota bacterium]|nr:hypothetical protein [Acidobacteriota bacterium]
METEGWRAEGAGDQTGRGEGPGEAAGGGAPSGLTCDGMRRVALEEMALRRRRLGELTPSQERALESLLVSVADNISDLVSAVAARAPGQGRWEGACAPSIIRLGALSPARS